MITKTLKSVAAQYTPMVSMEKVPVINYDENGDGKETGEYCIYLKLRCKDDEQSNMFISYILKAIGDVLY